MQDDPFPCGVIVFFRVMTADGQLARSILPSGRKIISERTIRFDAHEQDYVVVDENEKFLGAFPREFVSAILPIETTGPSNENNPPIPTRN